MRAFVSPLTRFDASEMNATKRPSRLIAGRRAVELATRLVPLHAVVETLTRSVAPLSVSRTKTSV